jgi:FixJ family two-component response regulator
MPGLATTDAVPQLEDVTVETSRFEPSDAWPTVFVVDDDECLRTLVGDWVEHAGFRPVRLPGGEACLAALGSETPTAVILDLHMWGMSGADTLDAIQYLHPNVPVIAMTGDTDPTIAMDVIERGASEFLLKPVRRTDLIRTLLGMSTAHKAPVAAQ